MNDIKIQSVISICTIKDIFSWSLTSKSIIKNLNATNYVVVVPDRYVKHFKSRSPDVYRVVAESSILDIDIEYCKSKLKSSSKHRASWYYQQLLKIAALMVFSDHDKLRSLIWDADTFIVRKLDYIGVGKIAYGQEVFHKPYDEMIYALGLDGVTERSLISQFIQCNHNEIKSFIEKLQSAGNVWFDYILKFDSNDTLYFSEYECIGRFLIKDFGYEPFEAVWSRELPFEKISLDELENNLYKLDLDYVSIEYPDLLSKISFLDKFKFYFFTYGIRDFIKLVVTKL